MPYDNEYQSPAVESLLERVKYLEERVTDLEKKERREIAAMCLQGLLSNPALTTQSVMEHGTWPESAMGPALEAADRLLFHLQNTYK